MEKIIQTKTCKQCNTRFEITDKDLEFYKKVSPKFEWKVFEIPAPTLCPDCRKQRRFAFFNTRSLYKNKCLKCWKSIVSRFSIKSWVKNYCNECWSKDDWNQLEQWLEIDFSKNFFEQMWKLINNTIFQNLIWSSSNVTNNSVFTNHTSEIVDSYLVFEANNINNSLYCFWIKNSKFLVDCNFVWNSQYMYNCVDCYDMYKTFYCTKSFWCKFSYFLNNCHNCSHCIWCTNLNNKSYYLFNEPITKTEYEKLQEKFSNYWFVKKFEKEFYSKFKNNIVKYSNIIWSEDSIGDNIINSVNCINSFDILESQNCKYSENINYSADIFDVSSYWEKSFKMYESVSVWRYSNNILFSSIIWRWDNLIYCIEVKKSKNCFLCVNLEHKQYCILNKQYSKEEYEELVPKILSHMQSARQWGEFFPSNISPFWYNETVANEYFPLSQKSAIKSWFNWSNYESPLPKVEKIIPASSLPEDIKDIPDDILNRAIECEITKKTFKIIKQELEFYRKHNLPIPKKHPDRRHKERMEQRNPRKLFDRKCDKCWIDIKTAYSPERKEIIYCQNCYDKEVY